MEREEQAKPMLREIFIIDDLPPESTAMLQALYSRSPTGVQTHLEKARESNEFMKKYYVGYNHLSIGDCGTTTLFIENISILADKSIQNSPLYNGQETSTRFIDFSTRDYYNPLPNLELSKTILDNWVEFYRTNVDKVVGLLGKKYPYDASTSTEQYTTAIKARAFDIMRGFLPAAMKTQLSWHTTLSNAYKELMKLKEHPLVEVRELAHSMLSELTLKYPNSFSFKPNTDRDNYFKEHSLDINYSDYKPVITTEDKFHFRTTINNTILERNEFGIITKRPKWTMLPRHLDKYGTYTCKFLLDYGSFRDIQRHRNGLCRIPVLNQTYGFNSWYLKELKTLDEGIYNEAITLIENQSRLINSLKVDNDIPDTKVQYYIPLGFNVLTEVVYTLPQMVYVTELRSQVGVHPTLRKQIHKMHNAITNKHPNLKLYTDLSADGFNIARGKAVIKEKVDSNIGLIHEHSPECPTSARDVRHITHKPDFSIFDTSTSDNFNRGGPTSSDEECVNKAIDKVFIPLTISSNSDRSDRGDILRDYLLLLANAAVLNNYNDYLSSKSWLAVNINEIYGLDIKFNVVEKHSDMGECYSKVRLIKIDTIPSIEVDIYKYVLEPDCVHQLAAEVDSRIDDMISEIKIIKNKGFFKKLKYSSIISLRSLFTNK